MQTFCLSCLARASCGQHRILYFRKMVRERGRRCGGRLPVRLMRENAEDVRRRVTNRISCRNSGITNRRAVMVHLRERGDFGAIVPCSVSHDTWRA